MHLIVKIIGTDKQARITIPKEIMTLKEWNEYTEILLVPLMSDPHAKLGKETPIILKEVKR